MGVWMGECMELIIMKMAARAEISAIEYFSV